MTTKKFDLNINEPCNFNLVLHGETYSQIKHKLRGMYDGDVPKHSLGNVQELAVAPVVPRVN